VTDETVDPVAALIEAWTIWDRAALDMGERERRSKGKDKPGALTLERYAHAKEAAIAALGLDAVELHRSVAKARRQYIAGNRKGMSVPDAVTTALLEMGVSIEPEPLQEAS
jgi:hypothetical protein